MTTFSTSPRPDEPVIPPEAAGAGPAAPTVSTTGTRHPDPPRARPLVGDRADPADTVHRRDPVAAVDPVDPPGRALPAEPPRADAPAAGKPYGDPVSDLVHAAVADRPLEEVVDLITALERSPEHTRAVVDALRAAGIDRSVEDVTRLVALLTRPPRDAASADETIRAAAAHRSVEDVTLLVALLHDEPLAPRCREEALRAAATGRSVDELVELIDRLAVHRPAEHPRRPEPPAPGPDAGDPPAAPGEQRPGASAPAPHGGLRVGRRRPPARRTRPARRRPRIAARDRPPRPVALPVVWSSWLAAVALAVCAVTHFPLQRDGVPLGLHAFAVGLSVLCTVLALVLVVRPGALVLAGALLVPAVLAGTHAYGGSYPSSALSRAVDLALAPAWLATSAAVAAALLALAALVVRVASPLPGTRWSPWPSPSPTE
ncbi:hypothetical protein [Streptomyces pilosus]|uniref:hypothetical protein n=1 Tax=Streptomyces pilosus TaxID=28893 RepID=UPI0016784D6C|nr:hypothetical protein [Streptomyces pilosus]